MGIAQCRYFMPGLSERRETDHWPTFIVVIAEPEEVFINELQRLSHVRGGCNALTIADLHLRCPALAKYLQTTRQEIALGKGQLSHTCPARCQVQLRGYRHFQSFIFQGHRVVSHTLGHIRQAPYAPFFTHHNQQHFTAAGNDHIFCPEGC